jgi:uroporphyrinogen decarboxylase
LREHCKLIGPATLPTAAIRFLADGSAATDIIPSFGGTSMMNRRNFLSSAAAAASTVLARPLWGTGTSQITHKERVDRALRGEDVDRPPFTFYHHYKRPTAQQEADDHLAFHRAYSTDIVKVMNDFDYPKSTTEKWYELKPVNSPFPGQLATLERVRDGLNGDAYFIDTIYGPYMTAMILYQSQAQFANLPKSDGAKDEQIKSLHAFQQQNSEGWHTALEAITQSTLNHIRQAKAIGVSGTLVSVFNAESKFGSVEDYQNYSRPYDKLVFEALADTPLTVLHLHYLERPYIDLFQDFRAPIVQHSVKTSGISVAEMRKHYAQPILGGVDEIDFRKLTTADIRTQWTEAREQAGAKYIAAPGCSVPDNTTPAELAHFPAAMEI